jgi:hypothetical protein
METAMALPFFGNEYHHTIRGPSTEIRRKMAITDFVRYHGTTVIKNDRADLTSAPITATPAAALTADRSRSSVRAACRSPANAGYVAPRRQGIRRQAGGRRFYDPDLRKFKPNGLDAMQLEIAQPIRQSAQRRGAFIEHLGRGIASLSARLL